MLQKKYISQLQGQWWDCYFTYYSQRRPLSADDNQTKMNQMRNRSHDYFETAFKERKHQVQRHWVTLTVLQNLNCGWSRKGVKKICRKWDQRWDMETIHSESYSHIIKHAF